MVAVCQLSFGCFGWKEIVGILKIIEVQGCRELWNRVKFLPALWAFVSVVCNAFHVAFWFSVVDLLSTFVVILSPIYLFLFKNIKKRFISNIESLINCCVIQQECSKTVILWLLLPSARKSLASKCFENTACSAELIRYASLWGRSGTYSFLCLSCMFAQPFRTQMNTINPSLLPVVVGFFHAYSWFFSYIYIYFPKSDIVTFFLNQVMQELGLIGLRIQRMPSEPGLEFGIPSQYSYMTVSFYCLWSYVKMFG